MFENSCSSNPFSLYVNVEDMFSLKNQSTGILIIPFSCVACLKEETTLGNGLENPIYSIILFLLQISKF